MDVGKIVNKIRYVKIFDIILAEAEKPIAFMGIPNGRLEMRQKNVIIKTRGAPVNGLPRIS